MSEIFTPAFQAKELYSRNEEVAAEAAAANSDREVRPQDKFAPKPDIIFPQGSGAEAALDVYGNNYF